MIEIGGWPILWHIMKMYAHHGFREFFIALGYKGEHIKRFFLDYHHLNGSMTIDFARGTVSPHPRAAESWTVHLIETGLDTLTGGRVKRLASSLHDGTFMVTYGDGVGDIDLTGLLAFHKAHGRLATVTAVRPPARYGGLYFEGDVVTRFTEKPQAGEGWISGGFLAFEPRALDYLRDDRTSLEGDALERLAADRQLMAYRHAGFWQCMDTLREKRFLEGLWQQGRAPWHMWR